MPSCSCPVRSKQLKLRVDPNLATSHSALELISQKVLELRQDLDQGTQKKFKEIIDATSEDSSSCGQQPITFIRQVSALSVLPELLEDAGFPDDVKEKARLFLQNHARDETGIEPVRRHIAAFLQERDNCPADCNDVIVVPGLSASVKILKKLLHILSDGSTVVGLLTPVPQFLPLTTLFVEHSLQMVEYPLVEDCGWSVDKDELEKALDHGKTFCIPRAVLVVNPGHPTGHILSRENIENIIKFAQREQLLIVACEIYQTSVHDDYRFLSFKKVMFEMIPSVDDVKLVSFLLYSGAFTNGPGLRDGFMEFVNIEEQVKSYIKESISTCDSSPICSQVSLDCIIDPPKPQEASFPLFCHETVTFGTYAGVLARTVFNRVNRIPGLSCSPVQAGYCAFIKIDIPPKAVDFAKSISICPSTFYVLEMLQHCGIVTVPGVQYGQRSGPYYFMMSLLKPEEKLRRILTKLQEFQFTFTKKYQS